MILAVLDDLMFSSKIKTAATQLGIHVTFARSYHAAFDAMRKETPTLVILDLDNDRIDPLGIVSDMKTDPAFTKVSTLGFVSHVHTERIEAARAAGTDDVLARSAFAARLAEILGRP